MDRSYPYSRRLVSRARLRKRMAAVAGTGLVAGAAVFMLTWKADPISATLPPAFMPSLAVNDVFGAGAPVARGVRRIYPYSVVPGGVAGPAELKRIIRTDRVVAAHYATFDAGKAHAVVVGQPRAVHVSYRKGDKVYWTAHKVVLAAGETLLSDGRNEMRARCANRISNLPRYPVEAHRPAMEELDQAVELAEGEDYALAPDGMPVLVSGAGGVGRPAGSRSPTRGGSGGSTGSVSASTPADATLASGLSSSAGSIGPVGAMGLSGSSSSIGSRPRPTGRPVAAPVAEPAAPVTPAAPDPVPDSGSGSSGGSSGAPPGVDTTPVGDTGAGSAEPTPNPVAAPTAPQPPAGTTAPPDKPAPLPGSETAPPGPLPGTLPAPTPAPAPAPEIEEPPVRPAPPAAPLPGTSPTPPGPVPEPVAPQPVPQPLPPLPIGQPAPAEVPEPGSLWLFGLALTAMGVLRRPRAG